MSTTYAENDNYNIIYEKRWRDNTSDEITCVNFKSLWTNLSLTRLVVINLFEFFSPLNDCIERSSIFFTKPRSWKLIFEFLNEINKYRSIYIVTTIQAQSGNGVIRHFRRWKLWISQILFLNTKNMSDSLKNIVWQINVVMYIYYFFHFVQTFDVIILTTVV